MKIRRFLVAISMTAVATLAGACTGDDDDDDGGSNTTLTITGGNTVAVGATLQLTATTNPGGVNVTSTATWVTNSGAIATVTGGLVTPVNIGQATITATLGSASDTHIVTVTGGTATADIIEGTSFIAAGGTELWICLQSQFDGSIVNIATAEGMGGCSGTKTGLGLDVTSEAPSFHVLVFDGLTGCTAGPHDWWIDYEEDEQGCENCVNQEYLFTMTANDAFGDMCGLGTGSTPIEDLSAYTSYTTGESRFTAVIGASGPVGIQELLIYDQGGTARLAVCNADAIIDSNETGLFDVNCDVAVMTSNNTYSAIVKGTLGSTGSFQGRIDFDYVPAPTP